MRRHILTLGLTFAMMAGYAQTASDYIVKTKGVETPAVATAVAAETPEAKQSASQPVDFVSKNFKFFSLCEWQEGMRFMVLPEKYDLIVKTFTDAETKKEVSSLPLRYHIMAYKGHGKSDEVHDCINFYDETNGKNYYYEIPSGTFEDYCYAKTGVPTLAYLRDVDIAREKLIGKTLVTRTTTYRVDTDAESDGFKEVRVPTGKEVKVVKVGVGTRNFPVKIIVEDAGGNQFYQNVALSKTNSGMRDEEFSTFDNARNAFYGSFNLQDDFMEVSSNPADYVGKTIHTKFVTGMITKGDGRERTVRVPKMTTFTIDNITQQRDTKYVTLSLTEVESRRAYFKDVTFAYNEGATDETAKKDDFFGYIFAMGEGAQRETSQAARAAIRAGRVIAGMTEDEVQLAVGEPDDRQTDHNGLYRWIYDRSKGKVLVVHFGRNGLVQKYTTDTKKNTTTTKGKTSKNPSWMNRQGTPLMD